MDRIAYFSVLVFMFVRGDVLGTNGNSNNNTLFYVALFPFSSIALYNGYNLKLTIYNYEFTILVGLWP